ncbi:MAG: sulfite exporter TauE/SafE family protein [Chloroflexota bacterium]|nr:sulfite exporter TauE/SafE family protein [Chloroflexota bacterium]
MEFSLIQIFVFVIVGFFATSYGVLVGAGGGFIIGPTLMLLFDFSPQSAVGTSILCVSIASLSGAISYYRLKIVDVRSTILFSIAAMPGAILAVIGLEKIDSALFNILFAIILFLTGLYVYWSPSKSENKNLLEDFNKVNKNFWKTKREINTKDGENYKYTFIEPIATSVNVIFGFISSFFGIGGGPLRTPTLVYFFNFPVKVATATSVATMSIYTLFGSSAHFVSGNVEISAVIPLGIGGIFGSQFGVIISKRLKGRLVMKLLSFAMIAIAISMGIEGFNNL